MITRILYNQVERLRKGYPVLMITGPRQSGKTTLARSACADLRYVNFESPFEQAAFRQDPVGFLSHYPDGAILDEAQHVPEIFNYLQVRVDEIGKMGRWVVTGSQQLDLNKMISQSLAGRVAILELLPFSLEELRGTPREPNTLAEAVLRGGYPPLYDENREMDAGEWLDNYLATYVGRDVQSVLALKDRTRFDVFIRHCASLSGQLVNKADLAQTAEIDPMTASAWLNVLEMTYLIRLLRPHHRNFGKRLNKRPKLHFLDTGLACRLLHIDNVQQLTQSPQWGGLVESWTYGEILKWHRNRAKRPDLWFWRSSDGIEVDILMDKGATLVPFEMKAGLTPKLKTRSGLSKLKALNAGGKEVRISDGFVVYGGHERRKLEDVTFVPWKQIPEMMEEAAL
ncbi:MAG: ATP-binding protein [Verrucomicrobia bacterium]|nr:ATP-binding protein [Verrucomicrobiota bacterium]MCH8510665.1 ATP-binding protein [Kiritimatiellia bacterium]